MTMGKRRNAKRSPGGRRKTHGGATRTNSDKFSVFDFADDDLRVEDESRKSLSKFTPKGPAKRPVSDEPLDKYGFLAYFAKGTVTWLNDSGNEAPDVDCGVSPGSLIKTLSISMQKPVLYIESDEDGRLDLQTSTSSDVAGSKGSFDEISSWNGSSANDCDQVVIISPKYIKYGNTYYTRCSLNFSSRYISLEGSTLCKREGFHHFDLPISEILKIEHQPCQSVKADIVTLHLKFKDTNSAQTCSRNSGTVELEFVVDNDSQWSRNLEEIKTLNLIYEATWKTITNECSFNEQFDNITYPEGDPDAVFVSRRDVELLQPKTFINDTIIDFYIKYLLTKIKTEEQQKFHFFNTFFFQKLVDVDRISSRTWEGEEAFRHVLKWTRNIDIFAKDYIFIPVNFSLHWSLIVICHPRGLANLRDQDANESVTRPFILHMDSIRGSHRGVENCIRRYLWEEWKQRYGKQDTVTSTEFSNISFIELQLPQQENLFDCGIFLLHYAELFLEQAIYFSTTKYSDFLNEDWFPPAEVSIKKRDHIRKLINRIFEDNALKNSRVSCENNLQNGEDDGDSGVKVVQMSDARETYDHTKFKHGINHQINWRQSFVDLNEPENAPTSVGFQEKEIKEQASSLPQNTTSTHQTGVDDKSTSPNRLLSSFRVGEIDVPFVASIPCPAMPPMIIDLQSEENSVPKIASTSEKHKGKCDYSSVSSEDLVDCIVEDSEEENDSASTKKSRDILYIF